MATVKIALVTVLLTGCTAAEPSRTTPDPGGASETGRPVTPTTPGPAAATPTGTLAPAPTGPAVTPAGGRVVLTRTGGFAGRGDTVTVEPDGRWTAVDRAGSRRSGQLDRADLDRLRRLVADPRLTAEAGRAAAPTGCRDAFSYRLTVGRTETGYVDCPTDGALPEVTRSVVELLERATG
ncbi:protealysin inhibitor emfourin [Micromonospora sp. LZ34]